MKTLSAAILFLCVSAFTVWAEEAPVFTNSDLGKYGTGQPVQTPASEPSAVKPGSTRQKQQPAPQLDAAGKDKLSAQKEWCERGTAIQELIKESEDRLAATKEARAEAWRRLNAGNRSEAVEADANAQKDQEKAAADLAEARQAKERLEDEAHRANIPPGWLRCQFE